MTHKESIQGFPALFHIHHFPLYFQYEFSCHQVRPICSCVNAALLHQNHKIFTVGKDFQDDQVQHLKLFYLPEETSGTHSPACKLKLSHSAHSVFSVAFLCPYWVYLSQMKVTELHMLPQITAQLIQRHQHLAKRTRNSPKALPPFAFSTAVSHHSSVLWQLSCTVVPSPPRLPSHDLLMVDLFLLLTSPGVYCGISNLHSPHTQLLLCNCPILSLSHGNDNWTLHQQ